MLDMMPLRGRRSNIRASVGNGVRNRRSLQSLAEVATGEVTDAPSLLVGSLPERAEQREVDTDVEHGLRHGSISA
jgi:hypothetical protein